MSEKEETVKAITDKYHVMKDFYEYVLLNPMWSQEKKLDLVLECFIFYKWQKNVKS